MSSTKPAVRIRAADYDRLSSLADRPPVSQTQTAAFLRDELARATVVADDESQSVQMGMQVRFRDHATNRVHDLQLVYPGEADTSRGRISVMTPVGTALVGLAHGATMPWRDHTGVMKQLTILAIEAPDRAALTPLLAD